VTEAKHASSLFRTKPIQDLLAETAEKDHSLKKALRVWDLIAIGIGCIFGVGIFVLPGVQAATLQGLASFCLLL
jgi:APA family basic amino acid/polyamine antiporter